MSQPKDPSNETMLELILQHPRCSHFKKIGTDDYRDPANDHFKLSSKGYADFKSGEFGKSLTSFAKKEGLEELIEEARKTEA